MPTLLIVEKSGNIKELNVKQYVEEDLYKKAGFKSDTGFKCQTTWNVEIDQKKWSVSVFAKTTGRAGQENKYDFPPPVDSTLFFGSCILVAANDDLREADWAKIYEFLFGGFEDIGEEDSENSEEDEDDEYDDAPKTKDGYVKDGFIVDDDDDSDEDDSNEDADDDSDEDADTNDSNDDENDEDTDEPLPPPKPVSAAANKNKKSRNTVFDKIESTIPLSIPSATSSSSLDFTSELVEEEYV
jgi:hypothetical protein